MEAGDVPVRLPPDALLRPVRGVRRALLALPIGQRWHRSRKKAAVLARCIRALEAVGHGKAVEALRALVESEKKPGVMDVFSRVARRELTPEEGARLLHK